MTDRALYFTGPSPFGRAIRVMLDEIGLDWRAEEAARDDTAADRARRTPALQVPVFTEGDLTLWDSSVIAEYLMTTYPDRRPPDGLPPLAPGLARPDQLWADKQLFTTIQTLGQSIVLISQMRWSGVKPSDSSHVARSAERVRTLAAWLDGQLPDTSEGFMPGVMSAQDVFCVCHLMFAAHRPLEIGWNQAATPKLAALCARLQARPTFQAHPIAWWAPEGDNGRP